MEHVSVGNYRTHDQPKNFAIKVVFSKVTPANVIPSTQLRSLELAATENVKQASLELINRKKNDEQEKEEVTIQWQEKLFSEKDFEFYQNPLNSQTSLGNKYHEDVTEMLRNFGGRINKRIFTYTDNDSSSVVENIRYVTLSSDEVETSLVQKTKSLKLGNMKRPVTTTAAQSGLRKRQNIINYEPSDNFKNTHVITTPLKSMKIMVDMGYKDVNGIQVEDERILCEIYLNSNGSLITKPDIGDNEVHTLETNYGVRCVYQYTLKHMSPVMTTEEQEQEARLINELYARHEQLKISQIGNEFYPVVDSNELYVYSYFEIECARSFEYDSLYVQYMLDLPDNWNCFNKHQLSGVTQSCAMNSNGVAHFAFPFEFHLSTQWNAEQPAAFLEWPILYLQVYSLDSWQRHRIEGYGYCQLPDVPGTTRVQVDMWRPKGDSMFAEVQRFFIGGTPELQDHTFIRGKSDTNKLNRFYFKAVTSGNVILKLNTMFQSKVADEHHEASNVNSKWRKVYGRKTGSFAATLDPLTHVYNAFQKARKRMLAARSTLPSIT